MRMVTLMCVCALSLFNSSATFAFDAAADAIVGMDGGGPAIEDMKPSSAQGAEPGAGERSARSIECSQKADAQGLHGKPRRHFMHVCKSGE